MNSIKEQLQGSLRFEWFAMLSAPAAGLSWNTYKKLHFTVKTPDFEGKVQARVSSSLTFDN